MSINANHLCPGSESNPDRWVGNQTRAIKASLYSKAVQVLINITQTTPPLHFQFRPQNLSLCFNYQIICAHDQSDRSYTLDESPPKKT